MYGTIRQQQFQGPAMMSNAPLVNAGVGGLPLQVGQGQMQQMNAITQQPPPQPVPAPQPLQTFVEKMPIGLDHAPPAFNLREQVIGAGGANLQYIHKETGVQITLRGIGSLYMEANTNAELQEPMHLLLEHQRYDNLNSAKQLAKNLIETLHQEFVQFQQATGTQVATPAQVPPPQLNVPPPNVIANVPPPAVPTPMVPQQQQQLSVMQQQFIPQMQISHNGMIIQQQTPNLSMPPPMAQNQMMSMKPSNQIQLQFHQPPPALPAQQTPFILNTQPQPIQYQYIQQTTTRDMQGNQQVTLQPIIQQSHLPIQHQQQYITVQQGNTAYMVPQSTIIHQTPISAQPTQLSIIHQQAQATQPGPQLQMQVPVVNVQPSAQQTAATSAARNETKTDSPKTSSSSREEHDSAADSNPQEGGVASEFQTDNRSQHLPQQSMRQPPPGIPITSVPPPPLNMSVPPPVQHFVGNTLVAGNSNAPTAVPPQQQLIQATPTGQSYMANNGDNWTPTRGPPPPLGQPIAEQSQQVALTFTQQPLQHSSGQLAPQFIQLQQQPQQQQQFSIIQTTPLNSANALQQQQQHQLLQFHQLQSNTLQMQQQQQQQLQFSQQTQLMQKQQVQYNLHQQQQIRQQTQISSDSPKPPSLHTRPAQKRRSTSEPDNAPADGPPPQQQLRTGMGPQSNLTNVPITSASAQINHLGNSTNAAESGGVSGQDNLPANSFNTPKQPQQSQQHMKPTHIGVMRYNQDPQRSAYDSSSNHGPRGRAGNFNARPQGQQAQQLVNSNYGQRMQFIHSQPPPPLPQTMVYGTGAGGANNNKHNNNNSNYGPRRMPRP